MRRIKTLGFAVIAALALTALTGASPASATDTTLCKAGELGHACAEASRYPKGTALKASSSKAVIRFTVGFFQVKLTCESTLEGETGAQSGKPLGISVTSWSLTNCVEDLFATPCSATAQNAPYAGSMTWTSQDDGTLGIANGGKGAPGWRVQCEEMGLDCIFSFEPSLGFEGGSTGHLVAKDSPMSQIENEEAEACPGSPTTKFTATYNVDSPKPVHVAKAEAPGPAPKAGTVMCEAKEAPCLVENVYPQGTKLGAHSSEVTASAYVGGVLNTIFTCEATIEGETTASGATPLPLSISDFSLEDCEQWGGGSCSASEMGLPYKGSFTVSKTSPGNGLLEIAAAKWLIQCDGFVALDCYFRASETGSEGKVMKASVVGGNPGTISFSNVVLAGEEDKVHNACLESLKFTGNFTVTSPKPMYVEEYS